MNLKERLNSLVELGKHLSPTNQRLEAVVKRTSLNNSWFTEANQWQAIAEIKKHFLSKKILENWMKNYPNLNPDTPNPRKTVTLILAGNIPLVGFHDIMCVYLSGHKALIKWSEKDPYLIAFIVKSLEVINPKSTAYFELVDGRVKDFDAVIATGSNNSSRYFETYFGKYPNIIRKNRNAVAILRGDEKTADFKGLGKDIFSYFGLGCRNVSKIYVPKGYNFDPLLRVLHTFNDVVMHDKYKNNFDYQFALVILNKVSYVSNGCLMMIENEAIASPIAMVYYEYYDDFQALSSKLLEKKEEIQCVISSVTIEGLPCFDFGEAQKPSISDYADGVDVMDFLTNL
jgi:hypothetical protein